MEAVTRHRFTAAEYHLMGEAGIFHEGDRVELIDGEVLEMNPIGDRHVRCVNRLTVVFVRFADGPESAGRYEVNVQNPVALGEYGEPQPDLALVESQPVGRLPGPGEISLLVEVAETSLAFDRDVKLPRYAEAGVPETWIVNLGENVVEVYSDPGPERYRVVSRFGRGERVGSATIPGLAFDAAEALPPEG